MSRTLNNKKNLAKFQAADPTIESLQEHLLKSLSTAFDPTAATRSDDYFLSQDYSLSTFSEVSNDPFKVYQNPYQTITERARNYVEKAQVEKPKNPLKQKNPASVNNKQSNTFLTYVEVESRQKKSQIEKQNSFDYLDYKPPAPEITYDGILGDFSLTTKKMDDLEELRKMIRKTKKDMNDYGKELFNLKKVIVGINDYAVKELGYGASNDLLHNMENKITSLNDQNEYHFQKKNNINSKTSKLGKNRKEEIEARGNKTLNSKTVFSGAGNSIVSNRNFGSNLRATLSTSKRY